MKFTRLRLTGFKSFVEPMEFVIEPGLTGVVGPNGCGKSNLVEALRWVMGENSYKNMRASGMDDVIFSGSGNRPARNTAEVALWLDNGDRTAPAAFNDTDEIQVSRRIERENGSVYRINGKEARARDVQLLFADASTGARSPSMVGQGRIGELIQAKPQARRQLLEEAAGISGLHSRRHEAELRLKAAETNLDRLEDVTAQLDSQIESLKRQARQANRFKMLSAAIREREAMLLYIRWKQAEEAETEANTALNEATNLVAEKAQAQMEAAKQQAVSSLRLPELREAEARAGAALQRLQIARSQLDEEASRILKRRDELTRRLAQLGEDIAREERLVADNAAILERLAAEEESITAELADSGIEAEETRAAFEAAAAALTEAETLLARLTAERAEAAAGRGQIERMLIDLAGRRERLERQRAEAGQELASIDSRLAELPDPEEKREAVSEAASTLEEAQIGVEDAEAALAEARSREAALRPPADMARARLAALETEARTISAMLSASASGGDFTPVADLIEVTRGYETALGAALGEDLDSPTDPRAPAHWLALAATGDPALPEGAAPLAAQVSAPQALARRLAQTGLADAASAERLMAFLKPGQVLVTREGAVYRWDGHVKGADAPSAAALRLAQKNRLGEIEAEAEEARERLAEALENLALAGEDIREAERAVSAAREAARIAARMLAEAREALSAAERASGDLSRRRAVVAEAQNQLQAQIEDITFTEEEARERLTQAPDLSGLDARLSEQQLVVAQGRGAAAEARARHEGLARENENRQRRLGLIGDERRLWQGRAASAASHIATLREREAEAREEIETLEEAPEEFEFRRQNLLSEIVKAEEARRTAADRLAEAENGQRDTDTRAAAALAALAEARERRGRAEERLVSARERREDTEVRIRETLNLQPQGLFKLAGLEPGAAPPDTREVERELDRLKMERERLGAVNLRAEEEAKELADKLSALIAERDDVIDAIRKLRGAIGSLNREGRERLLAAFDVVNEQFKRLFTHLFNGGTAELQLIESDDPLEAGLEILARPPGKKPQTMTLLSGGEQALTAMALIFAVFLTNPAPICVLDEVDAPLDDHNVERYCNLMDEMAASTETRFIIITHNPITMSRMDRLFGVTMAEQGVSQLVSVDLQTAERLRDAG